MTSVPSNSRPNVGDTAATGFFRDCAGYERDQSLPTAVEFVRVCLRAWTPGRDRLMQRGETAVAKGKRTFQPNNRRRARVHGFRLRMRTRAGRAIVTGRRRKGRRSLTA